MVDLHTAPDLIDRLTSAARRSLTENEVRSQRISFIMSGVDDDSSITREQVEKVVLKLEGQTTT